MTQFDLVALSSIALVVLALYENYRRWGRRGQILSLVLLGLATLQAAWLLHLISPWGALDVEQWTVTLAGMIACTALGLLSLNPSEYAKSAMALILVVSLLQLLYTSGIIRLS